MANFSTLVEPFDTLDDAIWGAAGNVDCNGDLVIQPDGSGWTNFLFSSVEWKLDFYDAPTNGFVEFVPYATRNNGRAAWGIVTSPPDVNQGIIIEQTDASTYTVGVTNGNNLTSNQSYATTDRFWRVVLDHDNASVYYTQSSADSVSWTFRKTLSVSDLSAFPFPRVPGVQAFCMSFRIAGGSGTTRVAAFRRINDPPLLTSVAVPGPATASSRAPVPVVQQWTTVNLTGPATAAVGAPAPTLKVYLSVPTSMSYALALEPVVLLPIPVAMSPPVITGSILAIAPDDVIAPAPNQINVLIATATCLAYPPVVDQLENTSLAAPAATASITLLPPGEYVRISAPPAVVSSLFLPLLRVGPALSQFASTVVQTPQNWGGAAVYYRLNDPSVTLTDLLGGYHGGWSGDHTLVASAVVNDPNPATQFNGTDTVAYNGLMPNYQPFTFTGGGYVDGGITQFRADEWPHIWGWSGMVVFRTIPGATNLRYVFTRDEGSLSPRFDLALRIDQGRLIARWYFQNDWQEITAGPSVNDGEWHMAVMSNGYPMDDVRPKSDGPCRLYLDGALQGILNFQGGTYTPTRPLTLGSSQGIAGNAMMEGALDEYAEFDYTLSKWEVIELWNQLNNLTGPGLRLETVPAYAAATMPAPTIRKSAVRPVNTFYDDFAAPFIDRTRWRDASPTARVINGGAVLRASGEQLLTADYFQAKDSTFIVRIDKLPIREGHIFVGLVNEYDIVDDSLEGGVNVYDPWRQHRTIGFDIWRSTTSGRTTTTIGYSCYGEDFHGTSKRQRFQTYVPDDPNYPSPMKWLRLDIDPGRARRRHLVHQPGRRGLDEPGRRARRQGLQQDHAGEGSDDRPHR
jgi:hypothetical protein